MKTLVLAFAAASLLSASAQNTAMTPKSSAAKSPSKAQSSAKADPLAVHRGALVIDAHADTTQRFLDENWNLGDPLKGGNLNLDSAKTGNLGAEFFSNALADRCGLPTGCQVSRSDAHGIFSRRHCGRAPPAQVRRIDGY
jgi:hypothetical protein